MQGHYLLIDEMRTFFHEALKQGDTKRRRALAIRFGLIDPNARQTREQKTKDAQALALIAPLKLACGTTSLTRLNPRETALVDTLLSEWVRSEQIKILVKKEEEKAVFLEFGLLSKTEKQFLLSKVLSGFDTLPADPVATALMRDALFSAVLMNQISNDRAKAYLNREQDLATIADEIGLELQDQKRLTLANIVKSSQDLPTNMFWRDNPASRNSATEETILVGGALVLFLLSPLLQKTPPADILTAGFASLLLATSFKIGTREIAWGHKNAMQTVMEMMSLVHPATALGEAVLQKDPVISFITASALTGTYIAVAGVPESVSHLRRLATAPFAPNQH